MNKFIGCLLTASLFISHLPLQGAAPKQSFNTAQFVGLTSPTVTSDERAVLDYELTGRSGGSIHFTNCAQVDAVKEGEIVESQHSLFKLLAMNCLALEKYSTSAASQKSFFPAQLTKAVVAAFPATAMVQLSEEDTARRQGKTLSTYAPILEISTGSEGAAKVLTAEDEITYLIMARADFDDDGIEDLLVRIDWHARTAMGKGSDLVLLSRESSSAPITLSWRSGP
jgi:hypothetical protein